jgi:hypothetical protein
MKEVFVFVTITIFMLQILQKKKQNLFLEAYWQPLGHVKTKKK